MKRVFLNTTGCGVAGRLCQSSSATGQVGNALFAVQGNSTVGVEYLQDPRWVELPTSSTAKVTKD